MGQAAPDERRATAARVARLRSEVEQRYRDLVALGLEATAGDLAALDAHPDVDLVLMDMMMPVMDGYEAARRIRLQPRLANLPVIALTAKAMKEDRQRCIEAGASDYLSKPVDPDRLVSLMRVWMSR